MQEIVSQKLERFIGTFPNRVYHRGQILVYANDPTQDLYFLKAGKVRQYFVTDDGNEVVLRLYRDNELFPSPSNPSAKLKSDYFYDAMSDIEVHVVPMSKFIRFLRSNPDVLMGTYIDTQQYIRRMYKKLAYSFASTAYFRLAFELVLECQQERKRQGSSPIKEFIKLPVHEYELANQTGLSRETANRELKKLKRKGIISISRKSITVNSILKLKHELGNHIGVG